MIVSRAALPWVLLPSEVPTPGAPGAHAVIRVGPYTLPLTDDQRQHVDRVTFRAKQRGLPYCFIVDDRLNRVVLWITVPLASQSGNVLPSSAAWDAAGASRWPM